MNRLGLVVLACTVMVVLAGCSGGPAASTTPGAAVDGGTDGSSSTETTDTETSDSGGDDPAENPLAGLETPPWLTVDGVDASRLVDAHEASLAGSSYRLDADLNASGLYALDQRTTVRVGVDDRRAYRVRTRTEDVNETTRAFANDTWVVVERTTASTTVYSDYRVDDAGMRFDVTPAVREYVRLGDYAVNRTVVVDGETRIEYVATSAADVDGAQAVSAYRGRLVVSPEGRIHSFTVTLTESSAYGDANTTFEFALSDVGDAAVSTPSWVATARARATTVDVAAEYDDGVVRLAHEGGDVVSPGTVVTVTALDASGTYRVELPREFALGDRVTLAPGDDGELALAFGATPTTDAEFDGRVRVQFTGTDGEVVLRTTLDLGENTTTTAVRPVTPSIPRADRWKQN